jgi:hypothetical protein
MSKTEETINTPMSKTAKVAPVATLSREPGAAVYYAIQRLVEMVRTLRKFHKAD